MSLDDEIDALYRGPLAEFTDARNALAKRAPADEKARIRSLQKPSAPAWAVNQLYWHRRSTFDRLIAAAQQLRAAHAGQLAGKRVDLTRAERVHQDAISAAANEAKELLEAAGDAASPATMTAIGETLQALPGRDDYGRLVKPLKPLGFEALAGLMASGAAIAPFPPKKSAAESPKTDAAPAAKPSRAEREAERRASEARKKELAAAEKALQAAQAAEREAQAALSRAEMSLARLQRERKTLQQQLDDVIARADELTAEMSGLRKSAERASSDRVRAADRVESLK